MITTSDNYLLITNTKTLYSGASIVCRPVVLDEDSIIRVDVQSLSGDGGQIGGILLEFSNTDLESFTGTGSTNRDKFFNQVEQAVKDYLENITENSTVVFTIV